MKFSRPAILLFALIFLGCGGGKKSCGKNQCSIRFINESISNIRTIAIHSSDQQKPINLVDLPIHETKFKCIPCEGECSFSLTIWFENGDTLKTINEYAESGYHFKARINIDGVAMETSLNPY